MVILGLEPRTTALLALRSTDWAIRPSILVITHCFIPSFLRFLLMHLFNLKNYYSFYYIIIKFIFILIFCCCMPKQEIIKEYLFYYTIECFASYLLYCNGFIYVEKQACIYHLNYLITWYTSSIFVLLFQLVR